jgi:hypothetical protein
VENTKNINGNPEGAVSSEGPKIEVEKVIEQPQLSKEEQFSLVDKEVKTNQAEIAHSSDIIVATKTALDSVRGDLGLPPVGEEPSSILAEKDKITKIEAKQVSLEGQKAELASNQGMVEDKNTPEISEGNRVEEVEKNKNPNSLFNMAMKYKEGIPTSPDRVYRSVATKQAIDDIENSGIVRNKQSAGLVKKSRWGERVYWNRGEEGVFHNITPGGYVIEAPLSVAEERVVTKDDVTAIYTRNEKGEIVNILERKTSQ